MSLRESISMNSTTRLRTLLKTKVTARVLSYIKEFTFPSKAIHEFTRDGTSFVRAISFDSRIVLVPAEEGTK